MRVQIQDVARILVSLNVSPDLSGKAAAAARACWHHVVLEHRRGSIAPRNLAVCLTHREAVAVRAEAVGIRLIQVHRRCETRGEPESSNDACSSCVPLSCGRHDEGRQRRRFVHLCLAVPAASARHNTRAPTTHTGALESDRSACASSRRGADRRPADGWVYEPPRVECDTTRCADHSNARAVTFLSHSFFSKDTRSPTQPPTLRAYNV